MIRTAWVALNATVATLFYAPVVIVAGLLGVRGEIYDLAACAWSRWILWASGAQVRIEGLEHLKLDEPQVIISNHQSWYDVFALAAIVPKRARFVAKKELARIPLFGPAWLAAGHIAIDRADRAAAIRSLERAGELIRRDRSSVVMFPEGTRSRTGELMRFKKGAFMLALHNGVEIAPVAVLGSRRMLPKGSWRVRPGPIIVRFGEPVATSDYDLANRDALITEVRARIQELLDAPRPSRSTTHA